ncbi:MAG: hypothetical protein AAFX06_12255 [Planctomycetota bacterium]
MFNPDLASGRAESGPCLVLVSFDRSLELEHLKSLASHLFGLYQNGSADPTDAEIVAALKDDLFRGQKRQELPDKYRRGYNLALFSVILDRKHAIDTPIGAAVLFAAVGEAGDDQVEPIPAAPFQAALGV